MGYFVVNNDNDHVREFFRPNYALRANAHSYSCDDYTASKLPFFVPRSQRPVRPALQGWKIHVSAPKDAVSTEEVAQRVLPYLLLESVWHKYVPMYDLYLGLGSRNSVQTYKFITVYPQSFTQLQWLIENISQRLSGLSELPRIPSDSRMVGHRNVQVRFGEMYGTTGHIYVDGEWIADNRNLPYRNLDCISINELRTLANSTHPYRYR